MNPRVLFHRLNPWFQLWAALLCVASTACTTAHAPAAAHSTAAVIKPPPSASELAEQRRAAIYARLGLPAGMKIVYLPFRSATIQGRDFEFQQNISNMDASGKIIPDLYSLTISVDGVSMTYGGCPATGPGAHPDFAIDGDNIHICGSYVTLEILPQPNVYVVNGVTLKLGPGKYFVDANGRYNVYV